MPNSTANSDRYHHATSDCDDGSEGKDKAIVLVIVVATSCNGGICEKHDAHRQERNGRGGSINKHGDAFVGGTKPSTFDQFTNNQSSTRMTLR